MRVVIAPDSFKESLNAAGVARAIAEGIRRALPNAHIVQIPMADGGEGTVDALVASTSGAFVTANVRNPLGNAISARYGRLGDGTTAVIEMAAASGLPLVPPDRRDPAIATTYGTGELIRHALDHNAQHIIVGLGGSATNDAGAGMAQALGFDLLDAHGAPLAPGGLALANLDYIGAANAHPRIANVHVTAACDVDTPLLGPHGASHVFAPQKGATEAIVVALDRALARFAEIVERDLGVDVRELPGGGAAGGLGAGLAAFLNAQLQPGFDVVAEACNLEAAIANADLVITGEGRLDAQSVRGKTPIGVARLAKKHAVPAIVIAGTLGPGYEATFAEGVTAAYGICPDPTQLDHAKKHAAELLAAKAQAFARDWIRGGTFPQDT